MLESHILRQLLSLDIEVIMYTMKQFKVTVDYKGGSTRIESFDTLDEALSLANEEVMWENTIKAKIFNDERLIREIEGTF